MSNDTIRPISWSTFREAGMIWWVNRILHLFGFALVVVVDSNEEILEVYPARTRFRGFSDDVEEEGFKQATRYLKQHAAELLDEAET